MTAQPITSADRPRGCPFCGASNTPSATPLRIGNASKFPSWGASVQCIACATEGPRRDGNTEAVAAWNRRPDHDRALEENRRLREALKPFLPAYEAYTSAVQNWRCTGDTLADRRASESECRATAEEAAYEALTGITIVELMAVSTALTEDGNG